MPNHIKNIVRAKNLKAVKDLMKQKTAFDFEAVLPLPSDLRYTQSPARIVPEEFYAVEKANDAHGSPITQAMSDRFMKLYGANNWYDWSLKNWDTKWNAYDIEVMDDCIEFQTAWSTPLAVFKEISARLRDNEIRVEYADEDIGSNCGELVFLNGELTDVFECDVEFACGVWGMDYKEYLKESEDNFI